MHILLVDNNRFYASVLNEMLLNAGFRHIEFVSSGIECIQKVQNTEFPDVIIIEENQLHTAGSDVIKTIRSARPNQTFIILTAADSALNELNTAKKEYTYFFTQESITADNLPQLLYTLLTEKINFKNQSPVNKAFLSFRKSVAGIMNS